MISLPINEQPLFENDFIEFLLKIEDMVTQLGVDYRESADDPDFTNQYVNLSFLFDSERVVDELIRQIRDSLTSNYNGSYLEPEVGQFPLAVKKTRIMHANCWSVLIYFSTSWKLTESVQC